MATTYNFIVYFSVELIVNEYKVKTHFYLHILISN